MYALTCNEYSSQQTKMMESISSPVLPPSKEDSLERIIARVNFYESSVEQLKKDVPRFFSGLAESGQIHSSLSTVLRTVASNEPHSLLQYLLFAYAQREEDLVKERATFRDFSAETKRVLDEWTKNMIQPMRVVIDDHIASQALVQAANEKKEKRNRSPSPSVPHTSQNQQPVTSSSAAMTSQSLQQMPSTTENASDLLRSLLPVHAKLFEKHRVGELKSLLRQMLTKQIAFHAKALEAYSQLFECLAEIETLDDKADQGKL